MRTLLSFWWGYDVMAQPFGKQSGTTLSVISDRALRFRKSTAGEHPIVIWTGTPEGIFLENLSFWWLEISNKCDSIICLFFFPSQPQQGLPGARAHFPAPLTLVELNGDIIALVSRTMGRK